MTNGDHATTPTKEPLIAAAGQKRSLNRMLSHVDDELHIFRRYLLWMCVDQSTWPSAALSWLVFIALAFAVPAFSHFVLACPTCDAKHGRPYDGVVQLSLTSVAALSFSCLSHFIRKYGLRRFLFLDKLVNESSAVKKNYTDHLNRSLYVCSMFVLPCFAAECAFKIWWYASGSLQIPFLGNAFVSDTVACTLELLSWLYRTTVFFLLCVLFRLICHLQIIRQQDFANFFKEDCDVESVLAAHLRLRRHLKIISYRFRRFILCALILVTISQFASLLMTTKSKADANFVRAGELALCSITLVTGLMIILRSATKITHKAQGITCLAVKWHACATIDSFNSTEPDIPVLIHQLSANAISSHHSNMESDGEDSGEEEDELDNTKIIQGFAYNNISYNKRQTLVTYFEHHKAGIIVYGFMIDRTWLTLIFGIELSLVLWLLGKTIGIS